jgi:hypothetical protein
MHAGLTTYTRYYVQPLRWCEKTTLFSVRVVSSSDVNGGIVTENQRRNKIEMMIRGHVVFMIECLIHATH